MADPRRTARDLVPAANANSEVIAVVQRLARQADSLEDPKARELILQAANDLLDASERINAALLKAGTER